MELQLKFSKVIDKNKDPAQILYEKEFRIVDEKDNNAYVALLLAIASFVPYINFFNIFWLYNIVSLVFCYRVLKRVKVSEGDKIVAIIAIVLNVALIAFSIFYITSAVNELLNG